MLKSLAAVINILGGGYVIGFIAVYTYKRNVLPPYSFWLWSILLILFLRDIAKSVRYLRITGINGSGTSWEERPITFLFHILSNLCGLLIGTLVFSIVAWNSQK